jgi:uncharacterized membrane protein YgaE (UPF0421/DUF939 family)
MRTRKLAGDARERVTVAWGPVALASVAAALAWLIAHRALGHPQPFFAPIAAAIALSTSRIQRFRRTAQMVVGVLLGIGVAEVLVVVIGESTVALGVIVFVTLLAALLAGIGFFGEGMMFANQAAASAILVVTLHRHGTGGERVIDALVGGAVAFVLGVLLFPAEPLSMLRDAERDVLRTLAGTIERVLERLVAGSAPDDAWTLQVGNLIHRRLGFLARAQATATANVRIAPRRWRLRGAVEAETHRTTRLELLSNAVLGLVRAAATDVHGSEAISADVQRGVASLGEAVARLGDTPQPWPQQLRREVSELANKTLPEPVGGRDVVATAVLRAAARDLAHLTETRGSP